jgi:hypothetical protein
VVTIGTPHAGSAYSNTATQWLGRRLISLPPVITAVSERLHLDNPGVFRDDGVHLTRTSIDALAPDSPALKALQAARRAPWVTYHNVIGKEPEGKWIGGGGDGDGVVTLASARTPEAVSEIVVPADHQMIHRHPRSVLEVRRVLLEHLRQANPMAHARPPLYHSPPIGQRRGYQGLVNGPPVGGMPAP